MGFGPSISSVCWPWRPCIVGTVNKMFIDIVIDNLPATLLKLLKEVFDG